MSKESFDLSARTDTSFFSQRHADCRCDWGTIGHDALASADVVIVVDDLSFSTCVDVATARGGVILPYGFKDDTALGFAHAHNAEFAGRRGEKRYSLSPASFLEIPQGFRCV